ncbi:TetR/AcrR family transcriptional regulator [Actinomycetospora sp. NBRC 106378]|uniref:TetR/AcrR family transcriptional regulator n=1 Tax=Actinomycetospora sp. NBRC 106378 TaxID=3032208 RepID=UPI0024A36112|nr:TetR/AcrR family transcriptional regulator [Actinomycetospora sp. NBRC 106378]GLZ51397.1 TetR family transcriptional regulator [Actinomycetospora sp. NBRC 106378]
MTTVELGRRERKKLATRAALSEAAVALSLEHGVEHVTIEQIADAADVSLRTFFNYFSSKEEAVVAGDSARGDVLVELVRARPADESVMTALRTAMLEHVEDLAGDDQLDALRMMRRTPSLLPHQLAAYADRERALAVVIAERLGDDVPDDGSVGLRAALAAAVVMAGVRVVLLRWTDGGTRDRDVLRADLAEMFDQLAAGLDDR